MNVPTSPCWTLHRSREVALIIVCGTKAQLKPRGRSPTNWQSRRVAAQLSKRFFSWLYLTPPRLTYLLLNNPHFTTGSKASPVSLLGASAEAPCGRGRGVSPQRISLPADNEMQQPYQCYRIIIRNKVSLALGITSNVTSAPVSKGPRSGAGRREGRMPSTGAEHPLCYLTRTGNK